ncbi:hypothetical protein AVEN_146616-1 [Araneus ventricosus]|uniref:Uncharacterized protein n=1 Tax=Araneus ventricosus TaxID=182803 RepID=A0A4Y2F189_ARAVE|nr:hypothetical protein AVEN_146616-1 [Araneus ventricosus]
MQLWVYIRNRGVQLVRSHLWDFITTHTSELETRTAPCRLSSLGPEGSMFETLFHQRFNVNMRLAHDKPCTTSRIKHPSAGVIQSFREGEAASAGVVLVK